MGGQNPSALSQRGMPDNVAGSLAYLTFIPAVLFLVMEPYNRRRTVRFHAWQSIYLTLVWAGINVVLLVSTLLPGIGWPVVFFDQLLDLGFVILWIYLMMNTFNGKQIKAPVVGEMAEKRAAV